MGGRERGSPGGYEAANYGDQVRFWRAGGYSETTDVRELHFSSQFVAFVDSEDGLQYPVFTPIVLSTNPSNPCDFGVSPAPSNSPVVIHSLENGFRSGWRSTILPCAGAETTYHVDSVLRVCHERQPLYLLFAVQCNGHYSHATGTFESGANCVPCNPCSDEQGDFTPVTKYVVFACRDADFQQRVFGPFDLQDNQEIPDAIQDQWIGVPQAFQSPDGEILFLYVTSRGTGRTVNEGLWVARMDDFLAGLSLLMQFAPGQGPAPLQEDPTLQILGQRHLAPSFAPLGALSYCASDAAALQGHVVDEHFVFCEERLHLYFTLLTDETDTFGNVTRRLRSFRHGTARRDLRTERVGALTPTSDGSVPKPAVVQLALEMCTNFDLTPCAPLDTDAVFGQGVTVVRHYNADGSYTDINAELNDPTVFPARPEGIEHGEAGARMVMLFGSSALRGLAVAASESACNLGICT